MATTSQTSSLPTASATSSSNGNSFYDLFSSTGSPPLIMTFLSIGLFIVAMTGVFGWRRLSQSRRQNQFVVRSNRIHRSISPWKRPMLWDAWTDLRTEEKSAMGWENITPMTAILTFLVRPVRPLVESGGLGSRVPFGMVRRLVSGVERFYLLDPPLPPPEPDKNEVIPLTSLTSDTIEWGNVSSLQVSVIITMPTQRRCGNGTSEMGVDPERVELGEFCIGMMDVPWSQGG